MIRDQNEKLVLIKNSSSRLKIIDVIFNKSTEITMLNDNKNISSIYHLMWV